MKLVNVGSLNIDRVYRLPRIVTPGQTLGSSSYQVFAGGKGANQSVAAARAGAAVVHVGNVGEDGRWLIDGLAGDGVDVANVYVVDDRATGHAIIQVDDAGQNAIVLHAGANHLLDDAQINGAIDTAKASQGVVITQNETNLVGELLGRSVEHGVRTCFNPAPMSRVVHDYPLEGLWLLIVNETEAADLAFTNSADEAGRQLQRKTGGAVVVTLGGEGAIYRDARQHFITPARRVEAIDTTAAGDTFIGYLVASLLAGDDAEAAMSLATRAAAMCVTRAGAIESIPRKDELAHH